MVGRRLNVVIQHVTVLLDKHGTDLVILTTTFPSAMPKVTSQKLSLNFQVENGKGVEYCRTVLGVEPDEVLKINN